MSALLLAVAAGPAVASCAMPREPLRLDDHEVVFAGQVLGTSNGRRAAEVRVLDVWRGPDLPPRVVVAGGELDRGAASSVDRTYVAGETYVFFVVRDSDGSLHDNACTPTALLAERVALDPPGTRPPRTDVAAPPDPRPVTWPWVAAGGLGAGAAAAAVVAARRTRRSTG